MRVLVQRPGTQTSGSATGEQSNGETVALEAPFPPQRHHENFMSPGGVNESDFEDDEGYSSNENENDNEQHSDNDHDLHSANDHEREGVDAVLNAADQTGGQAAGDTHPACGSACVTPPPTSIPRFSPPTIPGGHVPTPDHAGSSTLDARKSRASTPSPSGYNSGDEHVTLPFRNPTVPADYLRLSEAERERKFERDLHEGHHFNIVKMAQDGNCLFRSIADQVYGDPSNHMDIRRMTVDYMVAERAHFSQFITEDFDRYISRKRQLNCYGNNIEMQAVSELFNRPVEIYAYATEPINTLNASYQTDDPPIRLSYHRGNHYNSVVDPTNLTAGCGLGLPGYAAGLQTDPRQLHTAMKQSEAEELEKEILEESKLHADRTATELAIEQAVLKSSRHDHAQLGEGSSSWIMSSVGQGSSTSQTTSSRMAKKERKMSPDSSDDESFQNAFLPLAVRSVQAMGFPLPSCIEAYSIFGDAVDNMLCYLTEAGDSTAYAKLAESRAFEKAKLKRRADDGPL